MGTRRLAGFVAVALVLSGAGCGGGSSTVTAPSTPKQLAADRATVKQALLTLADLPTGYTATPHTDSGSDLPPAVEQKFLACTHLPKSFLDQTVNDQPNADAPDFKKGEIATGAASEIDSSVELDRSSKDISEPLDHLQGPAAAKCFEPFFHAAIATGLKGTPGVSMSDLTVKGISIGSIGDQRAAFEARVTISAAGLSIATFFDLYLVRKGRAGVSLIGLGFREPVSQSLEKALLQTMVGRLGDAS